MPEGTPLQVELGSIARTVSEIDDRVDMYDFVMHPNENAEISLEPQIPVIPILKRDWSARNSSERNLITLTQN